MTDVSHVSRRSFLQTTGGAGRDGFSVRPGLCGGVIGANDRIRVGFVGVGGQGMQHVGTIRDLQKSNNVEGIIVADCWKTRAEKGAGTFLTPRRP